MKERKCSKRPGMAIDREVFSCHPPKIESMVRSIIESFKNHTRDSVPVWMEKQGKPFFSYLLCSERQKR